MGAATCGGGHLVQDLAVGDAVPGVAFAGAMDDFANERRIGVR